MLLLARRLQRCRRNCKRCFEVGILTWERVEVGKKVDEERVAIVMLREMAWLTKLRSSKSVC